MDVTVPSGIDGGIVQPVVGTEVDHATSRREIFGDHSHARGVRQTAEYEFRPLGHLRRLQVFAADVEPSTEARMNGRDRPRSVLPRREGRDLDLGMIHKNLKQFERRVPGRPEDADCNHENEVPFERNAWVTEAILPGLSGADKELRPRVHSALQSGVKTTEYPHQNEGFTAGSLRDHVQISVVFSLLDFPLRIHSRISA